MADSWTSGSHACRISSASRASSDQRLRGTAKTPVDFANHLVNALAVKSDFEALPGALERMGMDLFNPPSVNGWNHSESWLATARFRERFFLAQRIAAGRSKKDGG